MQNFLNYDLSIKKSYLYWVRFCVRWDGYNCKMTHPRDKGAKPFEAFLTMLATEPAGV